MRAPLAATLVFLGACAAIVGLDDPASLEVAADAAVDGTTSGDATAPGDATPTVDSSAVDASEAGPLPPCDEMGLVGRWKLDEGSGVIAHDCTSGAHDGTIDGGQWATGKVGPGALRFAGNSVDVGNAPAFHLTAGMTLAAWVKQSTSSTSAGRILAKGSQLDRGWELNFEGATTIEFKIATDTSSYTQVTTSYVNDGQWHHIAGVYAAASGAMRIYIDGAQAASITGVPNTQRDAPFDVLIGAQPGETCCRFNGELDDVRIYGRGLTASDIQAIMGAQ